MNKGSKLSVTRFLCGILTALCLFTVPLACRAATNTERVNSLLGEILAENPNFRNNKNRISDEINRRLRIARERNYSDNICSNCTLLDTATSKKDVFEKIYYSNFWGSRESKSGPGSRISSTGNIRETLPKILEKYDIKSIMDAPCGDYNWMKTVDKKDASYIGIDIVPEIIRSDNEKFKEENISFRVRDITEDELPKTDIIFCRDCLQHLSHTNVKKALRNFKRSGSTYLLVTNYPWSLDNYDIKNGDFFPLNLCQKPFGLSKTPIEKIKETDIRGNLPDKYLYLYKLEDIDVESMFIPEQLPNNIPIAMALDENYVYPTVVSITSAMENSNNNIEYSFYIMHSSDLSEESKQTLNSLQTKYCNCKINLIDMKNSFKSARSDSRITTTAYYRLMLSDLLPDLDKIIYLDGNTIVLQDLSDIINIDMDGYCYKAFLDFSWYGERLRQFGISNDHYICDGVMLVNLEELRKNDAVNKFNNFISKNNSKLFQHDQTVINVVFSDKIGILPAKFGIWNWIIMDDANKRKYIESLKAPEKYTSQEIINASRNPAILHCVTKPWTLEGSHNFTDVWWQYAEKTDVFDKIKRKYCISDGIYTILSNSNGGEEVDIFALDTK